jgi:polyphosphate kinase
MPRNFFRRIEVVFPVEDGNLRERIISEILALQLKDNVKARIMRSDGSYVRAVTKRGETAHRSQTEFIKRTLDGRGSGERGKKDRTRFPRVKLVPRPSALKK